MGLGWIFIGDGEGSRNVMWARTCDMWCGRFMGRGPGSGSLSGHRNAVAESITLALGFCDWGDILTYCLATADEKYH